jgi:GWxTD domain-containing protein
MRTKETIILTLCVLIFSASFAQKLSVLMDYKSYYANEPYLEISSFVNGKTVTYLAGADGKYQAEVHITVQAFENDTLVNKLDYILVSEAFDDDIVATKPHFGGIEYLQLPNGEYLLQFTAQDVHANADPISYADMIRIGYPHDEVSISDISLYKNVSREPKGDIFDKYGFALEPLLYGYVPEDMYHLSFSCEIYNTDKTSKDETVIIQSYITCFENNRMPYPEARFNTQAKTNSIIVSMGEIGIFKLPSGNYNLVVDILSKDSTLLATNSCFFQRSNPSLVLNLEDIDRVNLENTFVDNIKDAEKLLEYVRYLYPISTPIEKDFYNTRMSRISTESLKKFFYAFWLKRDPVNPEQAWAEYLEKVKTANREFGCKLVQGYRTDRGRVFLQYGAPNSIFESPYDAHSLPYEIWHYYYCVDQSNVKFVFYNRDLVSNDFELIHSDKRGEFQDPLWKVKITTRDAPIYNLDVTEPEDYFGGNPKYDWFYHR